MPKYNNDKVDVKVGLDCQGVSKIIEKGNKKAVALHFEKKVKRHTATRIKLL